MSSVVGPDDAVRDGGLGQELLDAFVAVATERDVGRIVEQALEVALAFTAADVGGAVVFEDDEIAGIAEVGLTDDQVLHILPSPEDASLFAKGITVRREQGHGDTIPAELVPPGLEVSAVLAASVTCQREMSGAIYLARTSGDPFDERDEAFVRAVARQAANALTTVRLMHEKEREARARSEARFTTLIKHSSDVITVIDRDGMIRYQSPSVTRLFGFEVGDLIGTDSLELVHPDERPRVRAFITKAMKEPGTVAVFECRLRCKSGDYIYTETSLNSLLKDPEVQGLVLNTRDISERKALEEQLAHQAFHDSLTELPNRDLFRDRVEHALERGKRQPEGTLAVLFLDLDDFKTVNDSLGHAAGDQLLIAVGRRLREELRGSDTAARLGGDEFALLLEDITRPEDALTVAERVLDSMRQPFNLQGKDVFVRPSIGVAVASPLPASADELLRNADVAMYRAKSKGKGCYAVFEPSMAQTLRERLDMEADLRRAIDRSEFVVYYQPTVALQTGQISGMEALVRWQHPERGMVPPLDFIHLAEDTGLIVPIGRFVLVEACRQARAWQLEFDSMKPLTMSVNLSAKQLQHPGLMTDVRDALRESGLDPRYLVLEITESVLMQYTELVAETLDELKDLGVRLAIDDFGTGYSSLARLQRLPVDVLKIDRSFIKGLDGGSQEWAVTRAIIELGQSLRLQTVAEGIELPEQLVHLQSLQCDLCQGFYFTRPLEARAMGELLTRAVTSGRWEAGRRREDTTQLPARA
jgi:diguanylate cyclase (GGDEF)-like protein/PAS domain S-box-containing protein